MRNLLAIITFFVGIAPFAYGQDSIKKQAVKPIVKPLAVKSGVMKYPVRTYVAKPYQTKPVNTQPAATAPAPTQPAAQVNPNAPTPVSTDKSLNGQYQYVMSKTYHYQQPMIAALWKNVNDSLNATKRNLKEVQAKLSAQNQTISTLQNDVKTKEQAINETTARQNDINVMGIYMSKTAYNFTMWGLVIGLALVLLIVILRTTGNSREAKYRTQLYEELNEEFTAYKAKANDKEKKLARELQTERNKNDELMGRG